MKRDYSYRKENDWWVSPFNVVPDVTSKMALPEKVEIHDATLRDGEQTPGIVFSVEDKIAIAEKLAEVGVERIEAGMPAVSEPDFEAIKRISKLGLKSKIFTFARAMNADMDKALECGAHGVIIEVPIGYPKLQWQFKWTWEDVLRKSVDAINYARKRGLYTVYFPYDTTRAREEDLTNLLTRLMQDAPPDSVGVVDTMGCALPEAIKYMVRLVKNLTGLPVEVHTHNDFGMAVADGARRRRGRCIGRAFLREWPRRTHRQCGAGRAHRLPACALRLRQAVQSREVAGTRRGGQPAQ
jgi:methanogen homocitrate synthase